MVFSSIPAYLDQTNWQQPQNQQIEGASENPQLAPPMPPPSQVGGGGTGSIRPGSMTELARLANLPLPEASQKCPRCESTNTKFCYFNNYSLSQPRHFCKACRRYWTSGGALRSVPVGGGCRRNKRSKGSNSKSVEYEAGSSSSTAVSSDNCTTDIIGHFPLGPSQVPLLPPLHHLIDFNSENIGLNFGGGADMDFQIGNNLIGAGSFLSARLADQWRLQQVQPFPFTGSLEPLSGIYQFEDEGIEPPNYVEGATGQVGTKPLDCGVTHVGSVKIEENQGFNLSRNFFRY